MRTIKTTTISILALGLLAGSAVGVAAQDEEAADVATVTGTASWVATVKPADETEGPNGIYDNVGGVNTFRFFFPSDPRLSGNATVTSNWVLTEYGESFVALNADTFELSNDGGSWLGESTGFGSPGFGSGRTIIFVGQDGYEGLTAYLHGEFNPDSEVDEFQGLIFPSAMPEIPAPDGAE